MIKKAVILAAGRGKRMGPITKSIPKPMLPILDKPILHYLIDEIREAGIHDIYIVTSHKQEIIEDYFREDSGVLCVHQSELNGTATALQCVRSYLMEESFALLLGDELIQSNTSCLKEMIKVYEQSAGKCVTTLEYTTDEKIRMYNEVQGVFLDHGNWKIEYIKEKPTRPSHLLTSVGRYVLSPDIFSYLSCLSPRNGEYVLTDALNLAANDQKLLGLLLDGKRFDLGNKKDWLQTNLEFAKNHPEFY